MRATVSPLHRAYPSSAVFLQQRAGSTREAVSMRAYVCRNTLPPQIEAAAAHRLVFMPGQRD